MDYLYSPHDLNSTILDKLKEILYSSDDYRAICVMTGWAHGYRSEMEVIQTNSDQGFVRLRMDGYKEIKTTTVKFDIDLDKVIVAVNKGFEVYRIMNDTTDTGDSKKRGRYSKYYIVTRNHYDYFSARAPHENVESDCIDELYLAMVKAMPSNIQSTRANIGNQESVKPDAGTGRFNAIRNYLKNRGW